MNIFHRLTIRILKKNKVRTIVTIIGIVLSMTLFTAVLEGAWSGLVFMRDIESHLSGEYHGLLQNVSPETVSKVRKLDSVQKTEEFREVGFAKVNKDSKSDPYLSILSADRKNGLLPVSVISGRMPKNNRELLISSNMANSSNSEYRKINVGDTIDLTVGTRSYRDKQLLNSDSYQEGEKLNNTDQRTYTVVGICQRPSDDLVSLNLPGFVALTTADKGDGVTNIAFTLKNPYLYNHTVKNTPVLSNAVAHTYLLKFYGIFSEGSSLKTVVDSLVFVLIVMILFGSVSLIYNSFAISVNERIRQYGMLRSLGATKKQIRSSVYYEAMILSAIGIPIGLLIGCAGIGITLYALSPTFDMYAKGTGCHIHLVLSPVIIIAAILLCLIMALLSAVKPANRAVRISPIDAVRQSGEVSIDKSGRKAGEKALRRGHFYSAMAKKNYCRNRKRSRSTVFSIFLSVVLFISASSFVEGISKEVDNSIAQGTSADVIAQLYSKQYSEEIKRLWDQYKSEEQVSEASMYVEADVAEKAFPVKQAYLTDEFIENTYIDNGQVNLNIGFLDDDTFKKLCQENGLSAKKYMDAEKPVGIIYNQQRYVDGSGKSIRFKVIKQNAFPVKAGSVTIGSEIKEKPWFETDVSRVYFPISAMNAVYGDDIMSSDKQDIDMSCQMYFKTADHEKMTSEISDEIKADNLNGDAIDQAESSMSMRMMVFAARVFIYGFIILISLIAAANVFNIISTGVILRKREFAMLRSVGMSRRGLRKMLKAESLQYGTKALVIGIPVAVLISFAIWRIVSVNIESAFYLPVVPIVIAIAVVFAVIFISMHLAEKRISAANLIDALKDENI